MRFPPAEIVHKFVAVDVRQANEVRASVAQKNDPLVDTERDLSKLLFLKVVFKGESHSW